MASIQKVAPTPASRAPCDDRFPYGEARSIATGLIGERVHVPVFTMRSEAMRVISLRKANCREVLKYVDEA